MYQWQVVPICRRQRLDVRSEDLLQGGLYRKCDILRTKFDDGFLKYARLYNMDVEPVEFIVQLYGCPLSCWYCYVTRSGVWGGYRLISTNELVNSYEESSCRTFHLMGGAPALYLDHWPELAHAVIKMGGIFRSDFLLIEGKYSKEVLRQLLHKNTLFCVSIKGLASEEFLRNTGVRLSKTYLMRMRRNFDRIYESGINFYITVTGCSRSNVDKFKEWLAAKYGDGMVGKVHEIKIVRYKALGLGDEGERGW